MISYILLSMEAPTLKNVISVTVSVTASSDSLSSPQHILTQEKNNSLSISEGSSGPE